jgi:hypothetical protein
MKGKVDTIQWSCLLQACHNHITTALVNFGMDDATVCEANSDGGNQFYVASLGTFHKATDKIHRLCTPKCLSALDMDGVHAIVLLHSKGVSLVPKTSDTNPHFLPSLIKN